MPLVSRRPCGGGRVEYHHPLSARGIREVGSSASCEDNIVQKHTLRSPTRLPSVVTMGKTPVWREAYVQQ